MKNIPGIVLLLLFLFPLFWIAEGHTTEDVGNEGQSVPLSLLTEDDYNDLRKELRQSIKFLRFTKKDP